MCRGVCVYKTETEKGDDKVKGGKVLTGGESR